MACLLIEKAHYGVFKQGFSLWPVPSNQWTLHHGPVAIDSFMLLSSTLCCNAAVSEHWAEVRKILKQTIWRKYVVCTEQSSANRWILLNCSDKTCLYKLFFTSSHTEYWRNSVKAQENINPLSASMMASDQAMWDPLPSTNLLQTVMKPESGPCI